jgi:hypothetical protein
LQSLNNQFNGTRTENGALTNKSSLDPVVDYFGLAGAMRGRASESADLFEAALHADQQSAIRTLFYLRDVRGGQGERDVFRAGLKRLMAINPSAGHLVLQHVPFYGRWDDLFYDGNNVTPFIREILSRQWTADVAAYERGEKVSLMAKWLPSDKAANKELAINVRQALGLTQREYRQTLSALRARIELLEHAMSEGTWDHIDYGRLPGQAHRKHVKAFRRNDGERYEAYLAAVERGEAKINTSTLYPHEVYRLAQTSERAADVMWANLPDYTRGNDALVMADVSGSMTWEQDGLAMAVAVSLALYFADRNEGPYKDHFMTFHTSPQLIRVSGSDLISRLRSIQGAPIGGSTNVEAAFTAILSAGIESGHVPGTLYIVSDMEFNRCVSGANESVFQNAKRRFAGYGFELPHIVFWNVNARNTQLPATLHDGNVTLVSGFSPVVFGMAVEGKSPRQLVDDVINSERYSRIVL